MRYTALYYGATGTCAGGACSPLTAVMPTRMRTGANTAVSASTSRPLRRGRRSATTRALSRDKVVRGVTP